LRHDRIRRPATSASTLSSAYDRHHGHVELSRGQEATGAGPKQPPADGRRL